jgi:hypothetical protein
MIFHYTKGIYQPSIMAHGLMQSAVMLAKGEKPVLWFSTNRHWENTVFAIDAPTLGAAHQRMLLDGGLARIGCDDSVAPYRWKELREIASIPQKLAMRLYASAISVGSRPGEWRGTLESVPPEQFRLIEVFDGQAWIPASLEFAAAA